jgi:hypothetical protein
LIKTDNVENLTNIKLKHVSLKSDESVEDWSNILHQDKEFDDIRILGDTIEFRFSGDYRKLIQALGNLEKISDIAIENPTLEEVFLQYYSNTENNKRRN